MVHLMSIDAQKLQEFLNWSSYLLAAPLEIAVAIYLLWLKIGVATFAGLGFLLLVLALNSIVIGKKVQKCQVSSFLEFFLFNQYCISDKFIFNTETANGVKGSKNQNNARSHCRNEGCFQFFFHLSQKTLKTSIFIQI